MKKSTKKTIWWWNLQNTWVDGFNASQGKEFFHCASSSLLLQSVVYENRPHHQDFLFHHQHLREKNVAMESNATSRFTFAIFFRNGFEKFPLIDCTCVFWRWKTKRTRGIRMVKKSKSTTDWSLDRPRSDICSIEYEVHDRSSSAHQCLVPMPEWRVFLHRW